MERVAGDQHASAYVSIRPHTSEYVRIRRRFKERRAERVARDKRELEEEGHYKGAITLLKLYEGPVKGLLSTSRYCWLIVVRGGALY